jgi:hypothetical protein
VGAVAIACIAALAGLVLLAVTQASLNQGWNDFYWRDPLLAKIFAWVLAASGAGAGISSVLLARRFRRGLGDRAGAWLLACVGIEIGVFIAWLGLMT